MEDSDSPPFGFSDRWFTLGLVSTELLARMQGEWKTGRDHNPEHHRYRAFLEFLRQHRPLDAELAAELYALGKADPDPAMGGAMMADILRLPECPAALFETALAAGLPYLIRIVEKRRGGL